MRAQKLFQGAATTTTSGIGDQAASDTIAATSTESLELLLSANKPNKTLLFLDPRKAMESKADGLSDNFSVASLPTTVDNGDFGQFATSGIPTSENAVTKLHFFSPNRQLQQQRQHPGQPFLYDSSNAQEEEKEEITEFQPPNNNDVAEGGGPLLLPATAPETAAADAQQPGAFSGVPGEDFRRHEKVVFSLVGATATTTTALVTDASNDHNRPSIAENSNSNLQDNLPPSSSLHNTSSARNLAVASPVAVEELPTARELDEHRRTEVAREHKKRQFMLHGGILAAVLGVLAMIVVLALVSTRTEQPQWHTLCPQACVLSLLPNSTQQAMLVEGDNSPRTEPFSLFWRTLPCKTTRTGESNNGLL